MSKQDQGTESELTATFLDCKETLTRYLASFFLIREEVEDTLQQTYLDAMVSEQEKGVEIRSPKAYLFRVARNIALNKKTRQKKVFMENVGVVDDEMIARWQQGEIRDLADDQYDRDKLRSVYDAVQALPPQCRKVFLLQRMEGLTYKQIAKKLQISPRTVEKHLEKALKRCAAHLTVKGYGEDEVSRETGTVTPFRRYKPQ